MEKEWDCIIVGGGLAGLTAGIRLGRAGFKVLLIERNGYPKHKVCGEYISRESEWLLGELLPEVDFRQFPKISRLEISTPKGVMLQTRLPLGGIGISRFWLDRALAQSFLALGNGCCIVEDVVQSISKHEPPNSLQTHSISTVQTRDGQQYYAQLVLSAYGKWANLDNERSQPVSKRSTNFVGVKYHLDYEMPDDLIGLHLFEEGYAGISRVEQGRTCFCYMTTAHQIQKAGGKIDKLERQVLSLNPSLKQILTSSRSYYESPLVISQIQFHRKALIHDGAFRIGDAAGMIPPLCGNGMSMAMRSAWEAASMAIAYLKGEHSLEEAQAAYSRSYQTHFGLRLKAGRMLQHLVLKPQWAAPVLSLMQGSPWLAQRIIQLTHGRPWRDS